MERNRTNRFIALSLAASLGLTACGSSSSQGARGPDSQTTSEGTTMSAPGFTVDVVYVDGKRITRFRDEKSGENNGTYLSAIFAYCDGADLVEVTNANDVGGSLSRSVGHAACTDGRLEAADFPDLSQRPK